MAENLIQRVRSLEAEADAVVAGARETARQTEEAVSGEAAALREQFEERFRRDLAAFQAEQKERVARERADVDRRARSVAAALQSVRPDAAQRAVELVLKHLRGG